MKAARASQSRYENSTLEETEFALAISPCPRIEGMQDAGAGAEVARERSGLAPRRQVPSPQQAEFRENDLSNDLTETLTVGWALALAIAVALTVFISGG
jgi:hypothetical protein